MNQQDLIGFLGHYTNVRVFGANKAKLTEFWTEFVDSLYLGSLNTLQAKHGGLKDNS